MFGRNALQNMRLQQKLVPGTVIKLNVWFEEGEKEKYLVLVSLSSEACCFIANSKINPFLARDPATNRAQVPMLLAEHGFMHHDSFVNCSEVVRYKTREVLADLIARPDWVMGQISLALKNGIVEALSLSSTIPPRESAPLIAALSATK